MVVALVCVFVFLRVCIHVCLCVYMCVCLCVNVQAKVRKRQSETKINKKNKCSVPTEGVEPTTPHPC